MYRISVALKYNINMKTTKRRVSIGRNHLFAVKDANSNVTRKMGEVPRVSEKFTANCIEIKVSKRTAVKRRKS